MQLSITKAFGREGRWSTMALVGHFDTQSPQTLHLSISILEKLFCTEGASKGHTLTQIPQAIQPVSQFFLVSPPLSLEWQETSTIFDAGSTSITFFGHACSHFLQPVHFVISTIGSPSSLIVMALKGQTLEHVPYPRQPLAQDLSPPPASTAALQSITPSYLNFLLDLLFEPWHIILANLAS